MKKSKWETNYTITLSNGDQLTATGEMLNTIRIAFNECADRHYELGCESSAKTFQKTATEIYKYLICMGYFND